MSDDAFEESFAPERYELGEGPAYRFAAGNRVTLQDGRLSDVAPTILGLLGLDTPATMTGRDLLVRSPQFSLSPEAG